MNRTMLGVSSLMLFAVACSGSIDTSLEDEQPSRERPEIVSDESISEDTTSDPDEVFTVPTLETVPVTYTPAPHVFEGSEEASLPYPTFGAIPSYLQTFSIDTVAMTALIGEEHQGEFGQRLGKSLAVVDNRLIVQSDIDVRIYDGVVLSEVTPGVFAGLSVGDMGADGTTEVLLEQTNDPSWEVGVRGSIEVRDASLFYHGSVLQDDERVQGSLIEGRVLSNGNLTVASPLTYDGYAGAVFILSPEEYEGDIAVSFTTTSVYTGVDPNGWGQMVVTEWNDYLVVGMPADTTLGTTGVIYLVPKGSPSGRLDDVATTRYIIDADVRLGQVIVNIGDIDADGDDELAIGVPEMDSSGWGTDVGEVYILPGGETHRPISYLNDAFRLYPRVEAARTGEAVHRLGDLNSDGYDDFGVYASGTGTLCLYFGVDAKTGRLAATYPVCLQGIHDVFGSSAVYLSEEQLLVVASPHEQTERGVVYYVHMPALFRYIE